LILLLGQRFKLSLDKPILFGFVLDTKKLDFGVKSIFKFKYLMNFAASFRNLGLPRELILAYRADVVDADLFKIVYKRPIGVIVIEIYS